MSSRCPINVLEVSHQCPRNFPLMTSISPSNVLEHSHQCHRNFPLMTSKIPITGLEFSHQWPRVSHHCPRFFHQWPRIFPTRSSTCPMNVLDVPINGLELTLFQSCFNVIPSRLQFSSNSLTVVFQCFRRSCYVILTFSHYPFSFSCSYVFNFF